jgi:hypothetical protein
MTNHPPTISTARPATQNRHVSRRTLLAGALGTASTAAIASPAVASQPRRGPAETASEPVSLGEPLQDVNLIGAADDQTAQASQVGSNFLAAATAAEITSGDAVAGSQVSGVVAGGGSEVTIVGQNTSTFSEALSGNVFGANAIGAQAGPQAANSADVTITFGGVVADVSARAGAAQDGGAEAGDAASTAARRWKAGWPAL